MKNYDRKKENPSMAAAHSTASPTNSMNPPTFQLKEEEEETAQLKESGSSTTTSKEEKEKE